MIVQASLGEQTREVGFYTIQKITRIQADYLNRNNPRAITSARASLARLRKLDTQDYSPWMSVGQELFSGWPNDVLGVPEESSKSLKAVKTALKLYAYHQQSKGTAMAAPVLGADEAAVVIERRQGGFGAACRRLKYDLDSSRGIRQRLRSAESATDFDITVFYIRSLIMLMRNNLQPIPLDYRAFAEDLFRLQFDATRSSVFLNWGREYYTTQPDDETSRSADSKE